MDSLRPKSSARRWIESLVEERTMEGRYLKGPYTGTAKRGFTMNKFRSHLLATAALVTLAVIGSVMSSRRADAQGGPGVTIVAPLPLPVTGTVNASQSGVWNVGLQGTPNVNVANVPGVLVGNSKTNAVWIRDANEAGQPAHANVSFVLNDGISVSSQVHIYLVPAGKVLVLEYASVSCFLPAGQAILAYIITAAGLLENYPMTLSPPSLGPGNFTSVGSSLRLYADPSTHVSMVVSRTNSVGFGSCTAVISGHLVDL